MKRRTLLTGLVVGGSLAVGGIVGIPVLVFALTPREVDARQAWRGIGSLEDFPIGSMTAVEIVAVQRPRGAEGERDENSPKVSAAAGVLPSDNLRSLTRGADEALPRGAFVWRRSVDELVVYSRSCTDLGCPLTFDRGSFCFVCPCHGGILNKYGKRLAGPPDRPMYQYQVRVVDGDQVQVDVLSVPPVA